MGCLVDAAGNLIEKMLEKINIVIPLCQDK